MSRAWMPLYVADYLADTGHLSASEHGSYLLLIMHYWSNGCLPDDDIKLARIARNTNAEWQKTKKSIEDFFEPGWKHKRIDAELARAADKSNKAKASVNKRWSKEPYERIYERNTDVILPQSQSDIDTNVSINNMRQQADAGKFERFYANYPKRKNRKAAEARFSSAIRKGIDAEHIISAAKRYADAHAAAGTDPQYIPAPDVWLNKGAYDDEHLPQAARAGPKPERRGWGSLYAELNGYGNGSDKKRIDETIPLLSGGSVDGAGNRDGDASGVSGNLIELFAADRS